MTSACTRQVLIPRLGRAWKLAPVPECMRMPAQKESQWPGQPCQDAFLGSGPLWCFCPQAHTQLRARILLLLRPASGLHCLCRSSSGGSGGRGLHSTLRSSSSGSGGSGLHSLYAQVKFQWLRRQRPDKALLLASKASGEHEPLLQRLLRTAGLQGADAQVCTPSSTAYPSPQEQRLVWVCSLSLRACHGGEDSSTIAAVFTTTTIFFLNLSSAS